MSASKIKKKLLSKGIVPIEVCYERNSIVPEGYACGYSLRFTQETEDAVFELKPKLGLLETYMEFDTAQQVYDWIEELPKL